MWTDLMVDLETMGLPPDGAIVSIGACFFDLEKCEIGPGFSRTINLATAVRDGGTLNPGTVMWWLGQGEAARNSIRFSGEPIRSVLQEFSDFIAQHSTHREVRPWGNSISFDLTLLNSAYLRADMQTRGHRFVSVASAPCEACTRALNTTPTTRAKAHTTRWKTPSSRPNTFSKSRTDMLEKPIEAHLVKRVKERGGIAFKFVSPQRRSVPDRLCLMPLGRTVFVELKAPDKEPTEAQAREHQRLRDLGHTVLVLDTKERVDFYFDSNERFAK